MDRHAQEWDELAQHDALWAILSEPGKKDGLWDKEEFFATGGPEIDRIMSRARDLGHPLERALALDFGCGVGRVTRAMARHFDRSIGVDVSTTMIESARRLNGEFPSCTFVRNDRPDLTMFGDAEFDFVYCSIVLQHLPDTDMVESYVREFVRVLRPSGLLVFQLPDAIPFRFRLQPRRRAYSLLRRVGVPPDVLQHRLGLHPIRMSSMGEERVRRVLSDAGVTLLDVERDWIAGFAIRSNTYWVTHSLMVT